MNDIPINEHACMTCKWLKRAHSDVYDKCGRNNNYLTLERVERSGNCGPEGKYWTPKPVYEHKSW